MSLVSIIAIDKFISFMSDGRARAERDIVSENVKKIKKVNNKIIIGITGSLHPMKVIFEAIDKSDTFDKTNAEFMLNSLFSILVKDTVEPITTNTHILVGGLDSNGNIYYGGFSSNSRELEEIRVSNPNQIAFATSGGDLCSFNLQEKFNELIVKNTRNIKSVDDLVSLQMSLNQIVAKEDDTVNMNVFCETINK